MQTSIYIKQNKQKQAKQNQKQERIRYGLRKEGAAYVFLLIHC